MEKVISNEEFKEAYKNEDNIKIINSVLNRYREYLDKDSLKSCGMVGLFRCLRKHTNGRQKLTSSLYRFVRWECLEEISRKNKTIPEDYNLYAAKIINKNSKKIDEEHLNHCLKRFSKNYQNVIKDFLLENQNLKEISKKRKVKYKKLLKSMKNIMPLLGDLYHE